MLGYTRHQENMQELIPPKFEVKEKHDSRKKGRKSKKYRHGDASFITEPVNLPQEEERNGRESGLNKDLSQGGGNSDHKESELPPRNESGETPLGLGPDVNPDDPKSQLYGMLEKPNFEDP